MMVVMGDVLAQIATLGDLSVREYIIIPYENEDLVLADLERELLRTLFDGGTAIIARSWDDAMELRK